MEENVINSVDAVETDTPLTKEDIQVLDVENLGKCAVLKNAVLVEDIELVKNFAIENKIPHYVAIKIEENGNEKRFGIDDDGYPFALDNECYADVKIVEEVAPEVAPEVVEDTKEETFEVENVKGEAEPVEIEPIEEEKTETQIDYEAPEVVAENSNVIETTLENSKIEEENEIARLNGIISVLNNKIVELTEKLTDKNAEISTLNEKISLIEPNVLASYEVTLKDVVKFMKDNEITELKI